MCLYQYWFVSISGLTSICLPLSSASSTLLHSQQWETEGEESIPPGRVTPGISSFSLLHFLSRAPIVSPPPSTMTLLASERSLLIRNKFRSGEDLSSCQLKERRTRFPTTMAFHLRRTCMIINILSWNVCEDYWQVSHTVDHVINPVKVIDHGEWI